MVPHSDTSLIREMGRRRLELSQSLGFLFLALVVLSVGVEVLREGQGGVDLFVFVFPSLSCLIWFVCECMGYFDREEDGPRMQRANRAMRVASFVALVAAVAFLWLSHGFGG